MKKYFYFILVWIIPQSILFAQQTYSDQNYVNQSKYWFYRNRLINEFCKVGPNLGESLPVQSINYNSTAKYIEVGDGSIQKLGHYIGVLATEYKLLKNSNQSTDNTLRELYYALNAVKRLDQNAETYDYCYNRDEVEAKEGTLYPMYDNCIGDHNPSAQTLEGFWNGFLIRTDIDPRNGSNDPYISPTHKWFNNMTGTSLIGSDFGAIIPGYGKDKTGINTQGLSTINDMSHDQINHLLIGFRLIEEMLDGSETFNPGGGAVNLKFFALSIITKIFEYMRNGSDMSDANCMYLQSFSLMKGNTDMLNWFFSPWLDELPCSGNSPYIQMQGLVRHIPWLFENPVIKQPASIFASPGASFPFYYIQGYAKTGSLLTGESLNTFTIGSIPPAIWKRLASKIPKEAYSFGDGIKILTLVALSNSWDYPCATIPCFRNTCIIPNPFGPCILKVNLPIPGTVCAILGECESSKERLNEQAYKAHYEILPLLNNVLFHTYGYNYFDFETFYQSHINSAPCRGPYCFNINDRSGDDWSSWNMFVTPLKGEIPERTYGTGNAADLGEYNGLDYMLMYNLYNVYYSKSDYYVNYDNNLNLTNRNVVNRKEFYNARAYKEDGVYYNGNITASTFTVSQNSHAEFRAGSSIVLNPGFSVSSGSEFIATIYQPANNWEWEMTVCGSGTFPNGVPNGSRLSSQKEDPDPIEEIQPISDNYLGNCYPNPTADITVIPYVIAEAGRVEISIVDRFGKTVASPVSKEHHEAGKFMLEYHTSGLNTGVYYYILNTGKYRETKKMMIIK